MTKLGPQVIHSHLKHADLLAAHVAPRLQIPMVPTLHLVEGAPGTVGAFKRDIAVRARRRAARTIAVSDAVRRWYLDLTAAVPQTVVTVYNGVPAPVFSDGQREAVRLALDVPDDAVLVAMVAIMRPGKGHDVLLEAASRLPAGRQVQFVVAGSGPEEAGIRLAAHGLGLDGGRVRFLGFVDDVPALLAGCDLLVHPSMADALPTALIHGLAAGLPIVASDVGGIPEIVTDGVGILVPPGNADALGRAVADLGSNAEPAPLDRQAGQRAIRHRVRWRTVGEAPRRAVPHRAARSAIAGAWYSVTVRRRSNHARGRGVSTLALVLAVAVIASACVSEGDSPLGRRSPTTEVGTGDSTTTTDRTGDSTTTSRAPRPTTTTTRAGPVTTSGASAGEAYPAEVVAAYMGGCLDSEAGEEYCQCTIDEFQRVLTVQEFEAASERFDAGDTPEVFFDVVAACLSEIDTTGTTDPSVTTTTVVAAEPLTIDEVLQIAITDLNAYWTAQLPDLYGVTYAEPRDLVALSGNDEVRCGGLVDREFWLGNAFYCELGDYIAWDSEELIPNLFTSFGDFSVALVLAHEWGHAIQGPERGNVNGRTIMTELQADCFAGAWTGSVDAGESENLSLEQGDVEEAMAGYVQLFRDPPGTSPFDEGAHGTGFDRVAAFRGGFFNGPYAVRRVRAGRLLVPRSPLHRGRFSNRWQSPVR